MRHSYIPWSNEDSLRTKIQMVIADSIDKNTLPANFNETAFQNNLESFSRSELDLWRGLIESNVKENLKDENPFPLFEKNGVLTVYEAVEALHPITRKKKKENSLLTPFAASGFYIDNDSDNEFEDSIKSSVKDFYQLSQVAPAVVDELLIASKSNEEMAEILELMAADSNLLENFTETEDEFYADNDSFIDYVDENVNNQDFFPSKNIPRNQSEDPMENRASEDFNFAFNEFTDEDLEEIRILQVDGSSDELFDHSNKRRKLGALRFKKINNGTLKGDLIFDEIEEVDVMKSHVLKIQPSTKEISFKVKESIQLIEGKQVNLTPIFIPETVEISPNQQYFTKTIRELWSPTESLNPNFPSFFYDPPRAISPSLNFNENELSQMSFIPPNNYVSPLSTHTVPVFSHPISVPTPISSKNSTQTFDDKVSQQPKQSGFRFKKTPPKTFHLLSTLPNYKIPSVVYREPYFSNPKDVPQQPRVFAGREFKIVSDSTEYLKVFNTNNNENLKGMCYWKGKVEKSYVALEGVYFFLQF
ncbi:DNA polymerase zeta [Nowakowskiella sp. JEL0078]|nr:DNA polymerase zeta [Nowakowskiella sp. JEL0078]